MSRTASRSRRGRQAEAPPVPARTNAYHDRLQQQEKHQDGKQKKKAGHTRSSNSPQAKQQNLVSRNQQQGGGQTSSPDWDVWDDAVSQLSDPTSAGGEGGGSDYQEMMMYPASSSNFSGSGIAPASYYHHHHYAGRNPVGGRRSSTGATGGREHSIEQKAGSEYSLEPIHHHSTSSSAAVGVTEGRSKRGQLSSLEVQKVLQKEMQAMDSQRQRREPETSKQSQRHSNTSSTRHQKMSRQPYHHVSSQDEEDADEECTTAHEDQQQQDRSKIVTPALQFVYFELFNQKVTRNDLPEALRQLYVEESIIDSADFLDDLWSTMVENVPSPYADYVHFATALQTFGIDGEGGPSPGRHRGGGATTVGDDSSPPSDGEAQPGEINSGNLSNTNKSRKMLRSSSRRGTPAGGGGLDRLLRPTAASSGKEKPKPFVGPQKESDAKAASEKAERQKSSRTPIDGGRSQSQASCLTVETTSTMVENNDNKSSTAKVKKVSKEEEKQIADRLHQTKLKQGVDKMEEEVSKDKTKDCSFNPSIHHLPKKHDFSPAYKAGDSINHPDFKKERFMRVTDSWNKKVDDSLFNVSGVSGHSDRTTTVVGGDQADEFNSSDEENCTFQPKINDSYQETKHPKPATGYFEAVTTLRKNATYHRGDHKNFLESLRDPSAAAAGAAPPLPPRGSGPSLKKTSSSSHSLRGGSNASRALSSNASQDDDEELILATNDNSNNNTSLRLGCDRHHDRLGYHQGKGGRAPSPKEGHRVDLMSKPITRVPITIKRRRIINTAAEGQPYHQDPYSNGGGGGAGSSQEPLRAPYDELASENGGDRGGDNGRDDDLLEDVVEEIIISPGKPDPQSIARAFCDEKGYALNDPNRIEVERTLRFVIEQSLIPAYNTKPSQRLYSHADTHKTSAPYKNKQQQQQQRGTLRTSSASSVNRRSSSRDSNSQRSGNSKSVSFRK